MERVISADAARTPPPEGAPVESREYQAWLFAQKLRGITPRSAFEEEERRQFVAAISDRPAARPSVSASPSSTPQPGTPAYEAWAFAQELRGVDVSRLHEPTANEARRQELSEFVRAITEGTWDSAKHPRGAFPQNRGWFSPTWGPQGEPKAKASQPSAQEPSSDRGTKRGVQFRMVSNTTVTQNSRPTGQSKTTSASINEPNDANPQSPEAEATDEEKLTDTREFFHLLYGEKGRKLLKAFEAAGGKVALDHYWFGGPSELIKRRYERPLQIRIERELNPAEAAQELMTRLIDATGLTVVRQKLDHSGFDNIEILIDSYRQSFKQAAGAVAAGAELYLSGIRFASKGADLIVTINDLSEGNYQAAISFIFVVPARVGKTDVILKHGRKQFRVSMESIHAVKALPVDELLKLLGSTRRLARNMEKAGIPRPPNSAAHHIVPVRLKKHKFAEKARKILEHWEIGIENAVNGVYLPSKFDNDVKAAYHRTLHTDIYCEAVYQRLKAAKSQEDVLVALDQIRRELLAGRFPH